MNFQRYFIIGIVLLQSCLLFSQKTTSCGMAETHDPHFNFSDFKKYKKEFLKKKQNSNNNCNNKIVRVQFHIGRESDGTGGLDTSYILPAYNYTIQTLAELDVTFELLPNKFADNSFYYNTDVRGTTSLDVMSDYNDDFVINVYCFPSIGPYSGYAYFPFWQGDSGIFMRNSTMIVAYEILAHEFGHYFGLNHTHAGYSGSNHELANGNNCMTTGDNICDTPADPYLPGKLSNCEYIGTAVDNNGDTFNPLVDNIMSYTPVTCYGSFTPGQIARMSYYKEVYADKFFESPMGYTYLGEWQGSQYYRSINLVSFADAVNESALFGGHLASITSLEEHDFISSRFKGNAMIGLNDENTEGTIEWENGEPVEYTSFKDLQECAGCPPNSHLNDYVRIYSVNGDNGWYFFSGESTYIVEVPCTPNAGFPDIVVSNLNFDVPISAYVGQQLEINYNLSNNNLIVDQPFIVQLLLSADDEVDSFGGNGPNDIFLDEIIINEIDSETLENLSFSITIPDSLPYDGTYYLFVVADYHKEVIEQFKENNLAMKEIIISPNSNLTGCADLFDEFQYMGGIDGKNYFFSNGIAVPSEAKTIAESYGAHLAVLNTQAENDFVWENFPANIVAYIGINDSQVEGTFEWVNGDPVNFTNWDICDFCEDNTSTNDYGMMHPWNGMWSFANNERNFIIEKTCQSVIDSLPDLSLSNINGNPSTVANGEVVNITFDLNNIGTVATSGNSRIGIFISNDNSFSSDDIEVGEVLMNAIPIGTQSNVFAQMTINNFADGNYFLMIVADADDNIMEIDEENNTLISSIVIASDNGDDCPNNISGFTTLGEFNGSKYFISDGTSQPAAAQLVAEQNGGYLVVINDQAENDFIQQNISDMAYIGLSDVQTEGELIWGNGDSLNYNNINPCNFCDENSDNLDYVIMAPWDGTWSFSSQWNQRKYIVEIPCDVIQTGTPDLTLSNSIGVPTTAEVGDLVDLFFDINNIGTGSVNGDYITAAYLSTDVLFNSGDIYLADLTTGNTPVGIDSDNQLSFNIPSVTDGNYFIIVIVDVNGDIMELNSSNNGIEIPIEMVSSTVSLPLIDCNNFISTVEGYLCGEISQDGNFIFHQESQGKALESVVDFDGSIASDTISQTGSHIIFENGNIVELDLDSNVISAISLPLEIALEINNNGMELIDGVKNDFDEIWITGFKRNFFQTPTINNEGEGVDSVLAFKLDAQGQVLITSHFINPFDYVRIRIGSENNNYYGIVATPDGGFESFQGVANVWQREITAVRMNNIGEMMSLDTLVSGRNYQTPSLTLYPWTCNSNGVRIETFEANFEYCNPYELINGNCLKNRIIQREYLVDGFKNHLNGYNLQTTDSGNVSDEYNYQKTTSSGSISMFGRGSFYSPAEPNNLFPMSFEINKYNGGGIVVFTDTIVLEKSPIDIFDLGEDRYMIVLFTGEIILSECEAVSNCENSLSDFTLLGEYNGSTYFISDEVLQPTAAQLLAEQNGGYLAVINDQAENDFIQQHISEMVYIGLNDVQTEGDLTWGNGDHLNFDNINPCSFCNENSDDLDYVIMAPWDGAWSFSSQWNQRKCIVEIPCLNQVTETYFLTCPGDIVKNNGDPSGPNHVGWAPPTVFSDCPSGFTLEGSHHPSIPFPTGTSIVTYTLTTGADCGNVVETCTFNVTINTNNSSINDNSTNLHNPENTLISQNLSSVKTDQILLRKVFPNPTLFDVSVEVVSPIQQEVDIHIFDARGMLSKTFRIELVQGKNETILPIEDLVGGVYSIYIPQAQAKNSTMRFVKLVN